MAVLRAPGLRIELAQSGRNLVFIDAKDSRYEIPCNMTDANAAEYRKLLKLALDQLKDSVRKEDLRLTDATKALGEFCRRGRTLLWQIFCSDRKNCEQVVKIFRQSFPTWQTQKEPAVITVAAELSRFIPLEFLPLFDYSEWVKIDDWEGLEAAARRFLGFSAIIRREFPDLRVSQNLVLENEPKLPLKCFYYQGLKEAEEEIAFFARNAGAAGCFDFDGPWPDRRYNEAEFSTSLARHLHHADRRFNGKYRGTIDQIQHFVCHCDVNEELSSESLLRFSEGNNASIGDLQAALLTLEERKSLEDGPLVFLNACGTSRIDPMAVTSFPRFFLKDNLNRGFIGTETSIPDAFAAQFSQSFYRGLLNGLGVGQALYDAKWELLRSQNSPLGILYVVYADPDLHVSKQAKNVK
jgi:hypothetical protein